MQIVTEVAVGTSNKERKKLSEYMFRSHSVFYRFPLESEVDRLAFEQTGQPLGLLLLDRSWSCLSWTWRVVVCSLAAASAGGLSLSSFLETSTYFPSLAAWLVLVCLSSCSAGGFARFVSQSFLSVLYGSALLVGSSLDS